MLLKLIGTIGCLVFLIGISIKEFQKIGILIGSVLMFFYSLIVIKNALITWFTRRALRKHVLAFTTARACDGGAGAVYVLLKKRVPTKSSKV